MAMMHKATHAPIFSVPSYEVNTIPGPHPEELSSTSEIDRLIDLQGKYKQCQHPVHRLLSDNCVLKERTVKVEHEKRPSFASVISGPTSPAQH